MTVSIHPRSEVFGPALPAMTDGRPRPLLARGLGTMAVHYVGAGSFADPGDSADEIRAIERWASSATKRTPWEYNYVVDSEGELWTYAGEYRAAHSAGNNDSAIGVLALVGIDDPCTDALVLGLRRLRWHLVDTGALSPGHRLLPHRQLPGANTSCPGPRVLARWNEIAAPWAPEPTPAPIESEEDVMQFRYRDRRYTNVWLVGGGPALNVSGVVDQYLASKGVELVEDQHDQMLAGLVAQSGIGAEGLVSK